MKVGFIGFGEVASILTRRLLTRRLYDNDVEVISSTEGRSQETKKLAENSLATMVDSFEEVAESSDILISATTPYEALDVAKKYGSLVNGVFLDLNNISPKKTLEISSIFENTINYNSGYTNNYSNNVTYSSVEEDDSIFIKGAIMGSIKSPESLIYVSGENANELEVLNDYGLNIHVISKNVEDSAYIKMLRSIYTKGVTALLYEVFNLSENMGLTKELFESLINTEGENFEEQTKSRIDSLTKSHERKFQEMTEIFEFLKENSNKESLQDDLIITEATKNKFKDIK
ncbi:NAD(P)-binding domain-containing protein [Methanobrevibacter sp. TMH8]|uniref:NAD(P)-binding domain-containing protein n=1 Tax=Methanobrevibacter sp. TMH8 TaxID=2848611 RepID=UPI001CCBCFDD|nr:NAD(P)-binding domain-containing protein [Methanobrevibacter sp. TMH8]MBZ9570833.1 NAD(P)-binding domain-containing protein [Methanobrevibacter sp. TMH8]